MKHVLLSSSVVLATLSLAGFSHACDMHGAYGFYMRNSNWQPYNPDVSTTDPALADAGMMTPMDKQTLPKAVPLQKARPSFSNAANLAAAKAKTQLAQKKLKKNNEEGWGKSSEDSDEKVPAKEQL